MLINALPPEDRCIWALAFYAGLRRGEILALRWEDVDNPTGRISVERSYDPPSRQFVAPKSRAGERRVPIVSALRRYLMEHKALTGRRPGLVVGRSGDTPFTYTGVLHRATSCWHDAKLNPIGLHEARHSFASVLIAAGVNAKAVSEYMGHSSIEVTYNLSGHLLPGHADEAVERVDDYLARRRSRVVAAHSA